MITYCLLLNISRFWHDRSGRPPPPPLEMKILSEPIITTRFVAKFGFNWVKKKAKIWSNSRHFFRDEVEEICTESTTTNSSLRAPWPSRWPCWFLSPRPGRRQSARNFCDLKETRRMQILTRWASPTIIRQLFRTVLKMGGTDWVADKWRGIRPSSMANLSSLLRRRPGACRTL